MLPLLAVLLAQSRPDVALVPQVGAILRAHGRAAGDAEWEKPARLQDLWLTKPPRAADLTEGLDFTDAAYPRETGITVDWILRPDVDSDGRARRAYAGLLAALDAEATKTAIEERARAALEGADAGRLGRRRPFPVAELRAFHAQRVASRAVEIDMRKVPIDPEEAAFGHFSFFAVPVGRAARNADGTIGVRIGRFLVYVLDSFDFSKPLEPLGFFRPPDGVSARLGDGVLLTNLSYRDYRARAGRGGDFLVMTDAKPVRHPLAFSFRP